MKLLYLTVFVTLLTGSFGLYQNIRRFRNVGIENGPSQELDYRGYLWSDSQADMNRYDGKHISIYTSRLTGESKTIQDNHEDNDSRIRIGSHENIYPHIHPHFWQSWWFMVFVCLSTTALFIIFANKYLKTRLNAQNQESDKKIFLEKERSRIARDMYDSLGSELFGLKLLGQVALSQPSKEDANSYIQKIVDVSQGISEKISEVIWLTDSDQDNLESLWNYIRKNALIYLKPSGIDYKFSSFPTERNISVSGERRHDILSFHQFLFLELTRTCDFHQCEIRFEIAQRFLLITLKNVNFDQMDISLKNTLQKLSGEIITDPLNEVQIQIPLNG